MIHYIGKNKPWMSRSIIGSDKFWEYSRGSPYLKELEEGYPRMLSRMRTSIAYGARRIVGRVLYGCR